MNRHIFHFESIGISQNVELGGFKGFKKGYKSMKNLVLGPQQVVVVVVVSILSPQLLSSLDDGVDGFISRHPNLQMPFLKGVACTTTALKGA